jgi:hypothetical protein
VPSCLLLQNIGTVVSAAVAIVCCMQCLVPQLRRASLANLEFAVGLHIAWQSRNKETRGLSLEEFEVRSLH